jgi:very-short-patch-repair endonuclease/Mrp family chromosome partitioning ATPase
MVRDLESSVEALARHDLVAALAGDAEARQAIRDRRVGVEPTQPDQTPPADEFLVLDADSSQNLAINKVLAGQDLVIKGPPGTGKSQTIANLIAALAARGRSVLFVAEKRAAIDAVLERLTRVGLADLVLDLHGGISSKREVARSLADAFQTNASIGLPDVGHEQQRLAARRRELNDWVAALHDVRQPWDVSLFDAQTRLLALGEEAESDVRLRGQVLRAMTPEVVAQVREQVREFVGFDGLRWSRSPWAASPIRDRAEVDQAIALLDDLVLRTVEPLLDRLARANASLGLRPPDTLRGHAERLELWRVIRETRSRFDEALFTADLSLLAEQLAPLRGSVGGRWRAALSDGAFRGAHKHAKAHVRDGVRLRGAELLQAIEAAADQQRRWREADGDGAPRTPEELDELVAEHAAVVEALGALSALAGIDVGEGTCDEVVRRLRALRDDQGTLARLPRLRELRVALEAAGLAELLEELATWLPDVDGAVRAFEHCLMASIVEEVRLADPRVTAFDGDRHARTVADFQDADRRHVMTTPQRIRRLVAERAYRIGDEQPDQETLVRREAAKRTRHRPVRELFAAAPDVMTALKPCWVMSPLVVSQVLPNDRPTFDVVIFDEASQVRPAEAIPAIARGRQLVVAGDEKQLPPTDFFSGPALIIDDGGEEEEDAFAATGEDFESVLDALEFLLEPRTLEWHYRSADERLIAFSNAHLYGKSLVTFPGVIGPECLRHVHVPSTPGPDGRQDSSSAEVRRVVELILEHAEEHPDQSLGVIAMGIKHAERIDVALREALRDRPDLEEFFDETRAERFFVKNLERVQGDERDAIILTIGYTKGPDGRLRYFFGPLNGEGGERRLNVAVTRARRRMTVVSSFTAADMDPVRTRHGVDLLRRYLAYAESGGEHLDREAAEAPELNAFELDVRDALEKAGIPLVCQHGVGHYRLDFAARHPTKPGRLVLAIEADGASYHSAHTARDRDRLRQEQLERLGWRFHRIWSQDWFANREREVEKAVAAYRAAIEASDNPGAGAPAPVASPRPAPPPAAPRRVERGPRPNIPPWGQIDQFTDQQLEEMVRWIESDTLLRSRDELIDEVMRQLGFERRGKRIVARIGAAIDAVRGAVAAPETASTPHTAAVPHAPAAQPFSVALERPTRQPSAASAPIGWHDVEVVGESHHRPALRDVLLRRGLAPGVDLRVDVEATLVPEPDNAYDPNAVAVHVDGARVAYLARDVASRYQASIVALHRQGRSVTIRATIVGRDGRPDVGVFFALPAPADLPRVFGPGSA